MNKYFNVTNLIYFVVGLLPAFIVGLGLILNHTDPVISLVCALLAGIISGLGFSSITSDGKPGVASIGSIVGTIGSALFLL